MHGTYLYLPWKFCDWLQLNWVCSMSLAETEDLRCADLCVIFTSSLQLLAGCRPGIGNICRACEHPWTLIFPFLAHPSQRSCVSVNLASLQLLTWWTGPTFWTRQQACQRWKCFLPHTEAAVFSAAFQHSDHLPVQKQELKTYVYTVVDWVSVCGFCTLTAQGAAWAALSCVAVLLFCFIM